MVRWGAGLPGLGMRIEAPDVELAVSTVLLELMERSQRVESSLSAFIRGAGLRVAQLPTIELLKNRVSFERRPILSHDTRPSQPISRPKALDRLHLSHQLSIDPGTNDLTLN